MSSQGSVSPKNWPTLWLREPSQVVLHRDKTNELLDEFISPELATAQGPDVL